MHGLKERATVCAASVHGTRGNAMRAGQLRPVFLATIVRGRLRYGYTP